MAEQGLKFPEKFLWGVAGAAHQIEGGNVNSDCWVMENVPDTIFHEPSGDACDHYHRFESDIAMIAGLGLNSYRFSLEWSRIEPEPGQFSVAALDHYKAVLEACLKHGLTPIVTFNHFTTPRWFAARRGFELAENCDYFVRFCDRAAAQLGDMIPIAATFNEPNIGMLLQIAGVLPDDSVMRAMPARAAAARACGSADFAGFPFCEQKDAPHNIIAAHKLASEAIRSRSRDTRTGLTFAVQDIVPGPGGEARCAEIVHHYLGQLVEQLDGDDFIGAQIYTRVVIGPDGALPPAADAEMTLAGQEYFPEATEGALGYLASLTSTPILITENGVATADDSRRIEYINRALGGVHRAMAAGANVIGYCHWSVFDNYEWHFGYGPTYGIISVDRQTMARTLKPSATLLGKIARANAL
jgi:beta-glucosidase